MVDVDGACFLNGENGVSKSKSTKLSGYLFIVAGCLFFLTAYLGEQVTFYALGAVFVALGASHLMRARSP